MGDPVRTGFALVTCLVLAMVGLTAPRAAAAFAEGFSVTMVDAGDRELQGGTRLWHSGSGLVQLGWRDDGSVLIYVEGGEPSESHRFEFAPPQGEQLQVGSYTAVEGPSGQEVDQPRMTLSGEVGCDGGRFRILDIDPTAHRLWLVYEFCGLDRATLFGEIRINVPPTTSEATVAPTVVGWPAFYPGEAARPVPVRVSNTGGVPLTIGSPSITGGGGAFTVEGSDCWTVAPDDSCVVYVGFKPGGAGPHEALLTVPSSGPSWSVPLTGRGLPGHNQLELRSAGGDQVGWGRDHLVDPATEPLALGGTPGWIYVSSQEFTAEFDPAETLAPGTYVHGVSGGMNVSSERKLCQQVEGNFTVHEIAFTESGWISRLRLTFEQYCDGSDAPLFGSLAWRAQEAPVTLPPRVSVRISDHRVPRGDKVRVTATLERGAGPRRVSLVVERPDGTARVLATDKLGEGESIRIRRTIRRPTLFTVRSAGSRAIVPGSAAVLLDRS